jgi:putative glutamine amidotransferase
MNLSKSPIIGISGSLFTIDAGTLKGRERVFVGQDYVQSVCLAGGVPVILPIVSDEALILQQVEMIDGLILSGGYDVHPCFFGEEPHTLLEACYPDRDAHEIQLVRLAYQLKKPILGICRGIQLINVAFGGTLFQDLSLYSSNTLQHNQKARVDYAIHKVKLEEGTKLHQLFNQTCIYTNSMHHQSIQTVAPGFTINALAYDGIIEGIEKMDDSFILGVQWHPELMIEKDPQMLALFRTLILASSKNEALT